MQLMFHTSNVTLVSSFQLMRKFVTLIFILFYFIVLVGHGTTIPSDADHTPGCEPAIP